MGHRVGHIFNDPASLSSWWLLALAAAGVVIVEHHVVAEFGSAELRRRCRTAISVLVLLALSALVAPAGAAQPAGALLPDLISDPPNPSFFKELNAADGSTQLVVTFDGYVHNIGDGALDVMGNPQLADGMRQRVSTNGEWEDVGSPTVRFEVDDGHNHFHLIEVVEYVLWNELQGQQTAIGSKVGFCLVDSEQMSAGVDETYSEEGNKFCEEDNPAATELQMGISPGWRDTYDATTTLQWVDVSSVAPGRYWIGAITDPNDEIVESDEDNNSLVFSERPISIPGYSPRSQRVEMTAGADVVELTLTASRHGTTGSAIYVIEQGPETGELDVPIGAELSSPVVRYFPGSDFNGSVEILFSVRDSASPYPFTAPTEVVTIIGDETASQERELVPPPTMSLPSTFFETTNGEASQVPVTATLANGEPARVFATGLPRGLVADSESGLISGVAIEEGIFEVEIVALGATVGEATSQVVNWIVNPVEAGPPRLLAVVDRSTPVGELARIPVTRDALTDEIRVEGLPAGVSLEAGNAAISGTPTEVGEFDVTVQFIAGDELLTEATFTWTIRPGISIDFAL